MRTIDVRGRKQTAHGAYAGYFQLTTWRGLKVYGMGMQEPMGYGWKGSTTRKELNFSEARKDFKLLREIECSITPKVYEVVAVRTDAGWYTGIVIQHCQGAELWDAIPNNYIQGLMLKKVSRDFESLTGYLHEDLHGGNVIYNKKTKKYKVIDITMYYTTPSLKAIA